MTIPDLGKRYSTLSVRDCGSGFVGGVGGGGKGELPSGTESRRCKILSQISPLKRIGGDRALLESG